MDGTRVPNVAVEGAGAGDASPAAPPPLGAEPTTSGKRSAPEWRRPARSRLLFDGVVLAAYLVSANPALTGIPVHEWAGLGAFVLLAAHCAARGMWRGTTARGFGLTALNAFVLLACAVCVVSGVMVSGTVLPTLGLFADGYYFWDPLHAMAAKMLLALLLVHVAVHIPWIVRQLER